MEKTHKKNEEKILKQKINHGIIIIIIVVQLPICRSLGPIRFSRPYRDYMLFGSLSHSFNNKTLTWVFHACDDCKCIRLA